MKCTWGFGRIRRYRWILGIVCSIGLMSHGASAIVVLDQEAASDDPPSGQIGFSGSLTRAQTFTVGIGGTLDHIEVKVSGAATATFEIHPTTNGEPVLGSQPLGVGTVTFDVPSLGEPVYAAVDFSHEEIQVAVGDVLAIVQPGGGATVDPTNTPFWYRLNSGYRYVGGDLYTTTGNSPDDYILQGSLDAGFRTFVEVAPAVPGTIAFDADDRTDRVVDVYPEGTPCATTGVNGFADPGCTVHAGGVGPVFLEAPLQADLSWSGDIATLSLSAAQVAVYLTQKLGVVPESTTALTLKFDAVSGAIVGGETSGAVGDRFFEARLPTAQGALDFVWLNRSQSDRPFEGSVFVGTAFEKQVVASCATEGDAAAPLVVNGLCFLQQPLSPGFDPFSSTLTAFAQRDADHPIEDYSPEFDSLDFGIAEVSNAPRVPGVGAHAAVLMCLVLLGTGSLCARRLGPQESKAAEGLE